MKYLEKIIQDKNIDKLEWEIKLVVDIISKSKTNLLDALDDNESKKIEKQIKEEKEKLHKMYEAYQKLLLEKKN